MLCDPNHNSLIAIISFLLFFTHTHIGFLVKKKNYYLYFVCFAIFASIFKVGRTELKQNNQMWREKNNKTIGGCALVHCIKRDLPSFYSTSVGQTYKNIFSLHSSSSSPFVNERKTVFCSSICTHCRNPIPFYIYIYNSLALCAAIIMRFSFVFLFAEYSCSSRSIGPLRVYH